MSHEGILHVMKVQICVIHWVAFSGCAIVRIKWDMRTKKEEENKLSEPSFGDAVVPATDHSIPAFSGDRSVPTEKLRVLMTRAVHDWLRKTPSLHTRNAYTSDLGQFLKFRRINPERLEALAHVRP